MIWLRLIRWNNLLIILLTQLLAWWCVILPLEPFTAEGWKSALVLHPVNFLLLCASTMLIAAAGYVINDYFDIRIDAINKPDKVILEKQIPRRQAIIVHSCMNIVALGMAGIVAWQVRHLELLIIQLGCTFLLWRYSTTWKRQFMTGNLIVALMTMLTVIILPLYEPRSYPYLAKGIIIFSRKHVGHNPVWMLYFLCFFAFFLTWMREIVKDIEDFKGDAEEGCITMPIKWGLKKTILFVKLLGIISLIAIIPAMCYAALGRWFLMLAYLLLIFISITTWLVFAGYRHTSDHFHKASRYLKLIMVLGIGSLLLYRFQYA